jgi:hypothetical protein
MGAQVAEIPQSGPASLKIANYEQVQDAFDKLILPHIDLVMASGSGAIELKYGERNETG